MDKRVWLAAGLALLVLAVLPGTPLLSILFAFFVLGMIPGTALTIPFWVMLVAYPILFMFVVYWIGTQQLFIGETKPAPVAKAKRPARKKTIATSKAKRPAAKRQPQNATS